MNCNLCGGARFKLLWKGNIAAADLARFSQYEKYADIYRCLDCGLVVQDPGAPDRTIVDLIKSERYLDEPIGHLNLLEKHHHFAKLLRYVERYARLERSALLDVGSNTGIFLAQVKPMVGRAAGIEPSVEAAEHARARLGLEVENCVIAESAFADDQFDIITMWDVVEHLYDPRGDLGFLRSKLKPGGRIFITTHDIGSWLARLMGPRYPNLMYQHMFHFTRATLSRTLRESGYEIVTARSYLRSWSFQYLFHLVPKLWGRGAAATVIQGALSPLMHLRMARELRIAIPVGDFIIVVAERPG